MIPSTNTNVMLNAVLEDGEIVRGESQIPKKNKCIDRVFLEPENVEPMEEAIDALEDADLIVLGPGSLYTSVISNLCVKGMSEAILRSKAPKLYISNVMTQPGETSDYDVMDHIQAIHKHAGSDFIDYVICSNDKYDDKVLERYRERNAKPVVMDEHKITDHNIRMITSSNLVEILDDHLVRHNTKVLARLIYDLALEMTSTIQFRPKK